MENILRYTHRKLRTSVLITPESLCRPSKTATITKNIGLATAYNGLSWVFFYNLY